MDTSLLAVLRGVGLEEKEAAAYLALTELGQASASQIADKAGLKRSIVYYVLDQLKTAGYVQELPGFKVKRFAAADPTKVLEHSRSAVEELRFMLPLIRALQNKGSAKPRIEYFEGREAVLSVYRLFDRAKSVRFITSMQTLSKFMLDEVEAWTKREHRLQKGREVRELLVDTHEDRVWGKKAITSGRKVAILPQEISFDMDFAMSESMLAITSFDPLFIVVIHSESIARSAATLFDIAWKVSEEMKA
jgi:sugar-specific transcriptional regulator TrmB